MTRIRPEASDGQFHRFEKFQHSDLHRRRKASYIELSMESYCGLRTAVHDPDPLLAHRANNSTVTNSYGFSPPAKELTALRRTGRAFVLRFLFSSFVLTIGATKSVDAQHCGRVAQTAVWMDSRLSWERENSPSAFDSGRIRTSGCEGPMCRSRTPEPFSEPTSHSGAIVPLPWNCTSFKFVPVPFVLSGRILPDVISSKPDPFFEPLFEPPRFG